VSRAARHPEWGELMARPLEPEVADHVQACPQCRVDRRRLLVEAPSGALPPTAQARFPPTRDRIATELLPSVRSATSTLPRHVRRERLPSAGTPYGPYRAVGVLGRGETSVVLLGVHERHGTRHALKIVSTRDPAVLRQVGREHLMQNELRHPHLLPVVDSIDAPARQAILVLEFVDGPSLAALLRARAFLSWAWIDAIAIDVLTGLEALHEAGWVHRDLNPGNVLIDPNPRFRARVGDFGQVAPRGSSDPDRPVPAMPLYAAPEQLEPGRRAAPSGDVFALGSLLYELVTHQRCFGGSDAEDVARRVRDVDYLPVSELRPDTPVRIVQAIEAALTADLDVRPARAAELLDLWTRGAGEAARPAIDPSGAELAALRSMRGIERLPEARSALVPTTLADPTGQVHAVTVVDEGPRLPVWLQHGRWAMILAGLGFLAIVAFATHSARQPVSAPPPAEIRLDRGRIGVIDPRLAPNRRTLVFSDQQDLWVGPLDGSTPWTLTGAFEPPATQPTWSFDQGHIAFTGPGGIYTIDLRRGEDPVPVVPWARDPTWSPDGSRIVFVGRAHDGEPMGLRVWDQWTHEVVILFEEEGLARPTFAPDGSRLALETQHGLELIDVDIDEEGRLAVVDRRVLSATDRAPRWLDDHTLATWRAHDDAPGGMLVRWEETEDALGSTWRGRVILRSPHDVRSFEIGTGERWFVLGLSDPVPSVLRIERGAASPPTPVFEGSGPRGPAEALIVQDPDGALRRLEAPRDVVLDPGRFEVRDFGVDPRGGPIVYGSGPERPLPDWYAVRDGELDALARLSGQGIEGPFAWSADGRWLAAQLDQRPVVLDLEDELHPQLEAASAVPRPGGTVAALSPDGRWLLSAVDGGFALVDPRRSHVEGPPLDGLGATFADDDTLAVVRAHEVVLLDRETREVRERYALHPHAVPPRPAIVAGPDAIHVDGIVERGGLLRVDRLQRAPR